MKSNWILGITLPVVVVGVFLVSVALKSDPQPATAAGTPVQNKERPAGVITIGSISNEPGSEIEVFQPFADYLAGQLTGLGIGRGTVVVAGDIEGMAKLMGAGEVDLYFDSPFPMLAMQQLQGVRILARRWKKGVSEYHSVLFARKDSNTQSLDQIAGEVIAFEEPFSTSSYLLPKASLLEYGLNVVAVEKPNASVAASDVGYVFSNDDENTVYWVLKGKVAAGAINNQKFDDLPPEQRNKLVVFHRTATVPRQLAAVRSDLDSELVSRIKSVFLQMHLTDEGKRVLAQFEKTTKFDDFDDLPEDSVKSLAELAELISGAVLGDRPGARKP